MIRSKCRLVIAAILAGFGGHAAAQFPSQPIQLIVPYAAGGAADQMARHVARLAAETLNNPVVVVNKPGGNTINGTEFVIREKADGYKVLMVTNTNIVLNPLIYQRLSHDVQRDLQVLSVNFSAPLVLLAHNTMPFSNVTELKDYGSKNPDKLNYSSASATGPLSLTVEKLKRAMQFNMQPIAYSGGAPALLAVMSGEVQVGIDAFSGSMASIKAGKVKALAVTSEKRLEVMPEIPTVAETVPGFSGSVWYGFAVRSNTPADIQDKLKAAIDKAAADPDLKKQLTDQGLVVFPALSKKEVDQFIEEDRSGFGKIIKELDIKM